MTGQEQERRWRRWRARRSHVHLREKRLGAHDLYGAWLGSAYLKSNPRFWRPSDEVCPTECVVVDAIGNRILVSRELMRELAVLRRSAH